MNALGFSSCSNYLASIGDDSSLVIWEISTGLVVTSTIIGTLVEDLKWVNSLEVLQFFTVG